MTQPAPARAAIIGLAGLELSAREAALLRTTPPLGVILFARNIRDPAQLSALTASIRAILGAGAPILVDQEGGRVARLRPPYWPAFPAAGRFTGLPPAASFADGALLGLTCGAVGLDVVCAPVCDLCLPGMHEIVGDRGYGATAAEVVQQAGAVIQGLQAAGAMPVLKHLPGHGRARVDSHLELPRVQASAAELQDDAAPFAALAKTGAWGMTAHILYEAYDTAFPATLSPWIIAHIIRGQIGFDGFLLTDDLAMKALSGSPLGLAQQALQAGCDVALYCAGDIAENTALLADCPALTPAAERRLAESQAILQAARRPLDAASLTAERDSLLCAQAEG